MINKKDKIAFFAGLSAFIGAIENLIPLPLPFLRLGLANIPVSFSITIFKFSECLFIVLFKVIFSHLFRGTLFSYIFLIALSGNLFFLFLCYPFYHIFRKQISYISLCVLGALSHNFGQLLVAGFFIPYQPLIFIALFLFAAGIVLGFINGLICNYLDDKIFQRFFVEK